MSKRLWGRGWKDLCACCSVDLSYLFSYTEIEPIPENPGRRMKPIQFGKELYCSQKCLQANKASLSYRGTVHAIHQEFGPNHPVTKQVQMMRREIKCYRKLLDIEGKRKRGEIHEEINFKRLCHLTEKCL
jgi:hypothetical protein